MKNHQNFRRFVLLLISMSLLVLLASCSSEDQSSDAESAANKKDVTDKKQTTERVVVKKPAVDFQRKPRTSDVGSTMPEGFEKSYVIAVTALRKRDYELARSELNRALSSNNQEQLELILPGRRPGSYLPHFYLGEIEYQEGDCIAAMNHWEISLAQGVIQQTPNFADLQKSMNECGYGN